MEQKIWQGYGRDLIDTCTLIQREFPQNGTRYVAYLDDFDNLYDDPTDERIVNKLTKNDTFSRTISINVGSGKRAKRKAGLLMSTYPKYGFLKDPTNKHNRIRNPETALIVEEIIERVALKGELPSDIAKDLKNRKIYIPCISVGNRHTLRYEKDPYDWTANMIRRIVKDKSYQSWVIQGKTKKISYKSKKSISVPEEEWEIKKDRLPAIVDADMQNLGIKNIKSREHTRTRTYDWLLKGILECKECGCKLSVIPSTNEAKKAKNKGLPIEKKKGRGRPRKEPKTILYTRCNTYASTTISRRCTTHSNNLEELTNVILDTIRKRCQEYINTDELRDIAKSNEQKLELWEDNRKKELQELEKRIELINNKVLKIYDDKLEGKLTETDYIRLYEMYNNQRNTLKDKVQQMTLEKIENDKLIDIERVIKEFVSAKQIDRAILLNLVDNIQINQNKEIFIHYKFNILNETQ